MLLYFENIVLYISFLKLKHSLKPTRICEQWCLSTHCSLSFSQLLVTLVQEEVSMGMISYYSFSKETNMPHTSEGETIDTAWEFSASNASSESENKAFITMATFYSPIIKAFVCLNCCINKSRFPGRKYSPASWDKPAPMNWANLMPISAQTP